MPELLGLYHAYVKGFNKVSPLLHFHCASSFVLTLECNQDVRHHKLFIICTGGCHMLSDKFYNLSVDVRNSMTVNEVLESEEAYFLRRINGRSNARILLKVAEEFKLSIPTVADPCGYDPCRMASCTTETFVNDMHRQRDGRITVTSKCTDTTRTENGMLCSMHPSEGFWLFKVIPLTFFPASQSQMAQCIPLMLYVCIQGANRTHSSLHCYGGPFGMESTQTSIPSCMHKMHKNYSWKSKTVPGSSVCNRVVACSVEARHLPSGGSIAKVQTSFWYFFAFV